MPDCTSYWDQVDVEAALLDSAVEAWEQANDLVNFRAQQLQLAVMNALNCENGMGAMMADSAEAAEAVKMVDSAEPADLPVQKTKSRSPLRDYLAVVRRMRELRKRPG